MEAGQWSEFRRVLLAVAAAVEERAGELNALDAAIGDGDHGVNLAAGGRAISADIDSWRAERVGDVLQQVGMTLLSTIGGLVGPLFGTAFIRAGRAANEAGGLDGPAIASMLEAARDGVMQRGGAEVGEKTMVDALVPAAQAAREAANTGAAPLSVLAAGTEAARRGATSTQSMRARKGRASRLGDRSIGHQDAGATSIAVILEALLRAVTEPPGAARVAHDS